MRRLIWVGLLACSALNVKAQDARSSTQPTYTLKASSRVVLTDVLVTRADGTPVHGLKAEDFQLFDNSKTEALSSFEEHTGASIVPTVMAKPRPGYFSNEELEHLPPVVNLLLLDTSNLALQDQMYLYGELNRFLKSFPNDQPLAIFLRSGPEVLLVQDFTTDRVMLKKAVESTIPRFRNPDAYYSTDIGALHQIAKLVAPIAGRKNLLWFSGGTQQFEQPGDLGVSPDLRPIFDELEADRIAVYPIDARGLTTFSSTAQQRQHMLMNQMAEATGGKAYYNNNGLDTITQTVMNQDRDYYTLTYVPQKFKYDGKWHSVKVKLAGENYHLSYRTGYFADAVQVRSNDHTTPARTRLLADGSRLRSTVETDTPLIFEAHVLPAEGAAESVGVKAVKPGEPQHGRQRVLISYALPVTSLHMEDVHGVQKVEIGAAALILNRDGRMVGQRVDKFTATIDPNKLSASPNGNVRVKQEIDVGKGEQYLTLVVWDPATYRHGTLEVPLKIPLAVPVAEGASPVKP